MLTEEGERKREGGRERGREGEGEGEQEGVERETSSMQSTNIQNPFLTQKWFSNCGINSSTSAGWIDSLLIV